MRLVSRRPIRLWRQLRLVRMQIPLVGTNGKWPERTAQAHTTIYPRSRPTSHTLGTTLLERHLVVSDPQTQRQGLP